MEAIRVNIDVPRETTAGAKYTVHADAFDGVVDFDESVSRILPLANPREIDQRWLETPWLMGAWLQTPISQGWLNGSWLTSGDWLTYNCRRIYTGLPMYGPQGANGGRTVAVQVQDEMGAVSGSSPPESTLNVNTAPRPPRGLVAQTLSGGVVTLTFTPSPDLGG